MNESRGRIDEYLFNHHFKRFLTHVYDHSGLSFVSFNSNPYTEVQEGYKFELHTHARKALDFGNWKQTDIGSGRIVRATINAIELPKNNLVMWQGRFGEASRLHQPLYDAQSDAARLLEVERALYSLYHKDDDATTFVALTHLVGSKYSLLAYLFFLKDRSRYMPIAPDYFDKAFRLLGSPFTTSRKCSWENYNEFMQHLLDTRDLLAEHLPYEVSLLDAHSFVWMLARQMSGDPVDVSISDYAVLPAKDREAVISARIGQGRFREQLLAYWTHCAITGCTESSLLKASHIKPWGECDAREARDPFNGILLAPSLDAAFDAGYISFDDFGKILISSRLSGGDAEILGIHSSLRLCRIDPRHQLYLRYHRAHCFQPS